MTELEAKTKGLAILSLLVGDYKFGRYLGQLSTAEQDRLVERLAFLIRADISLFITKPKDENTQEM